MHFVIEGKSSPSGTANHLLPRRATDSVRCPLNTPRTTRLPGPVVPGVRLPSVLHSDICNWDDFHSAEFVMGVTDRCRSLPYYKPPSDFDHTDDDWKADKQEADRVEDADHQAWLGE